MPSSHRLRLAARPVGIPGPANVIADVARARRAPIASTYDPPLAHEADGALELFGLLAPICRSSCGDTVAQRAAAKPQRRVARRAQHGRRLRRVIRALFARRRRARR